METMGPHENRLEKKKEKKSFFFLIPPEASRINKGECDAMRVRRNGFVDGSASMSVSDGDCR